MGWDDTKTPWESKEGPDVQLQSEKITYSPRPNGRSYLGRGRKKESLFKAAGVQGTGHARGDQRTILGVRPRLHLVSDRVHLLLAVACAWLACELVGGLLSPTPIMLLGSQLCATGSDFYMGSGASNSGLHAWVPSPQLLGYFLKYFRTVVLNPDFKYG